MMDESFHYNTRGYDIVIGNFLNISKDRYSYRMIFTSGIIPFILLLSAYSATFQLVPYEHFDRDRLPINEEPVVEVTDIAQLGFGATQVFSKLQRGGIPDEHMKFSEITTKNLVQSNGPTTTSTRAVSGVDIAVSNQFDYNSIINELPPFYSAGEVGEKTTFTFWLENLGDTPASNFKVYWKIYDWYHNLADSRETTVSLNPSENASITFDWIPLYSNYYNVTLSVTASGDVNSSNDNMFWRWVIAVSWSQDFESGDLSAWSGNKATTQWHITNSIQNDPNTAAHSSPNALYHGQEAVNDDYGIGEDYYLISPQFDLRRFNSSYPGAYLLYQFYGGSTENKDELIIEFKSSPDKEFEYSGVFDGLSGDTWNDNTSLFEWQVWQNKDTVFAGIPISFLAGDIVQFRFHWHSDNVTEDKLGFYLDDFLLFGLEEPPPVKDAAVEDLKISFDQNPWDTVVAGNEVELSVKVKNYGLAALSNFQVRLSINDEQGRSITKLVDAEKTVFSLDVDSELEFKWKFRPEIGGNFYITIENLLAEDGREENDRIESTITVAKYLYNAEDNDDSWSADAGWSRIAVPNDPDSNGHSGSTAWYAGSENFTYLPDMDTSLTSPVIDLQGVNPSNPDIKVFANFKFFGNSQDMDKIYFEFALDGGSDWKLVNDGGSLGDQHSTLVSGYYGDRWYDIDNIKLVQVGSTDFVGHSVQFRWRFESDSIDEKLLGFFIDDLIVWGIEEDYGRPSITSATISNDVLENQLGDFAVINVKATDRDGNLYPAGVSIDLSDLGGSVNEPLYDDGTHGDTNASDGIFAINISAPPQVTAGDRVLTITAVDTDAKVGRGFIKLKVIENIAPKIVSNSPSDSVVRLDENDIKTFSITAEDPGDKLNYRWYIDGKLIDEGSNLTDFDFITNYDSEFSSGEYVLNVTVLDDAVPPKQTFFEWEISVSDILPDFELNRVNIELSNPDPRPGELVYFNVTVKNIGLKPEQTVKLTMFKNLSFTDEALISGLDELLTYEIDQILANSVSTPKSFSWTAEFGLHEFIFFADFGNNISESDETNNFANITIQVTEENVQKEPDDYTFIQAIINSPFFITAIIIIILTSTFGMAVGGTEIGRFSFFSMMVPLYSRLRGTKILSHQLREQIYNHIKQYPGDHYRSIMNKLDLKNGTLVHHLHRLEQEELIKSQKDGLYKRFYPVGMKIPQSNASMYYPDGTITFNINDSQVSEIQMHILRALEDRPGASQKEISEKISESRRVVNYHIKLLQQSKLIKVIRDGRETKCYLQADLT